MVGVLVDFDLIIKQYPNGPMSTHIHNMKPGETLDIKGPIKKYEYKANEFNHIGMLAGGTGTSPVSHLNPHDARHAP